MTRIEQIPERIYHDVMLSLETSHITGYAWLAVLIIVALVG